jgi:hypothetical protein
MAAVAICKRDRLLGNCGCERIQARQIATGNAKKWQDNDKTALCETGAQRRALARDRLL